jgi:PII-like signaling protein
MNSSKLLIVFVDERDRWGGDALYQAILDRLSENEIAGAVALPGIGAFGGTEVMDGIDGYARARPVAVLAVDSEEKLREVLPAIRPILGSSLMILTDVEVLAAASPALVT